MDIQFQLKVIPMRPINSVKVYIAVLMKQRTIISNISTSNQQASLSPVIPASNTSTSNQQANPVIKWNFPILGYMFLKVIEEFMKNSTEIILEKYCSTVATFAGCWYEFMFFRYLREVNSIRVVTASDTSVILDALNKNFG